MMSLSKSKLLKIGRSGTEQFYSLDTISGKICFKRLAKILVSILKYVHNSDIGLQYFRSFRFPFSGIKVIMA